MYGVWCCRGGGCRSGIEDLFKAIRRLISKGSENDVVHVERMFMAAAQAAPATFPAVAQQAVTADDWEAAAGHGGLRQQREVLPRWNRTGTALGEACWRPEKHTAPPKPQPGQITCGAPAHSQQVSLEECLLATELATDGSFRSLEAVTCSWVCSLVWTVHETAVGLIDPSVLVDTQTGTAFLVVLNSGRCVWGWPLRVHDADRGLLTLVHPVTQLTPIVLTNPYPWQCVVICGRHCLFCYSSTLFVRLRVARVLRAASSL